MPKVGDKKFPYTKEGVAAAEATAEVTGEEVIPTYAAGDRVKQYQAGGRTPWAGQGDSMEYQKIQDAENVQDFVSGLEGPEPNVAIEDTSIPAIDSEAYKKGGKVKSSELESLKRMREFAQKRKNEKKEETRKAIKRNKATSRVTSPGHVKKETKPAREEGLKLYKRFADSPSFRKKIKEWEDIGKTKSAKRGVKTYKPKKKK